MRAVILTLAALLMMTGCIPPPPSVRSVDLSQVRIGADRAAIERSLGLPESQSTADGERTIMVYRYGPQVDPGAIFVCEPISLAMLLVGCPVMNAGNRAAAEAAASHEATVLGTSLLQVVYDPNERADWVIFAGDTATLARTSALIARAECGNSAAQAELGRSLAEGAGGLPLDHARGLPMDRSGGPWRERGCRDASGAPCRQPRSGRPSTPRRRGRLVEAPRHVRMRGASSGSCSDRRTDFRASGGRPTRDAWQGLSRVEPARGGQSGGWYLARDMAR